MTKLSEMRKERDQFKTWLHEVAKKIDEGASWGGRWTEVLEAATKLVERSEAKRRKLDALKTLVFNEQLQRQAIETLQLNLDSFDRGDRFAPASLRNEVYEARSKWKATKKALDAALVEES